MAFGQKTSEQMGGVYYAYPAPQQVKEAVIPDGYTPIYVSHYGRHGSRWLTSDKRYQWVNAHFDDDANLTKLGRSVKKRLAKVWGNAEGNGGKLTPVGETQHCGIAHRMLLRFPWLKQKAGLIEARSSVSGRCRKSMEAFTDALKQDMPSADIILTTDSADMRWMSYDSPDHMLLQQETNEPLAITPDRFLKALFKDPAKINDGKKLMTELHTIASDMQDVAGLKVSLFDVFTLEEQRAIYESNCASMWHQNGYDRCNHGIPAQCAANLWTNIVEEADHVFAFTRDVKPAATLRFGHDTALYRLLSLLGVNHPLLENGAGALDEIVPMAANLQMVFCQNSKMEVLVSFWLNEKPIVVGAHNEQTGEGPQISLPMIDPKVILSPRLATADGQQWFAWNDVKLHYQKFINKQKWMDRTRAINTMVGTDFAVTSSVGKYGKGSEEHGQTLPAVLEPHGQTSWTPQTQATERKCIAPYYYKDTQWQGFRASHWLVGGCTQDYGSFTLQPMMGQLKLKAEDRAIAFNHKDEISHPYYYALYLPSQGLMTEMTARSHSAIFRFTSYQTGQMHIVVEPNSDEHEAFIAIDQEHNAIYGYNLVHRIYQGWGERAGFSGWFVVQFDRPIQLSGVRDTIGYVSFDVTSGENVMVKASSSFTSLEGAWNNLKAEIPEWDFLGTRLALDEIWQKQLQTIEVEGEDKTQENQFYGALYRSLFLPREMSDVATDRGEYRYPTFAQSPCTSVSPNRPERNSTLITHQSSLSTSLRPQYGDFSMWDIYRAQLPLLHIIEPKRTGDMMQSLVNMYQEGGWMPIFPCWNSYTAAMIGDHGASALADALVKNPGSFNAEMAYEGLRKNAFESPATLEEYRDGMGRRALQSYLKHGYIPLEDSVPDAFHTKEQVSRTFEYAYDDYCLAQMAKVLGHTDDYNALMKRSANWKNVINPSTGWADGRYINKGKKQKWLGNEDVTSRVPFITEGAVCHYSFYVPQDPEGLMQAMGGKQAFTEKLDMLFDNGYYWHGNEPCHQIPYFYALTDKPWKAQQVIRRILTTEYLDVPGGLSGNDDAGQMSAWYVFSALGFYPVCPGTPEYYIGTPTFKHARIGNLTIEAPAVSEKNIYTQCVTWNGEPYTKPTITHDMIMQGGTLRFDMGTTPRN